MIRRTPIALALIGTLGLGAAVPKGVQTTIIDAQNGNVIGTRAGGEAD